MPPRNLRGGKSYKKHKKTSVESARDLKFTPKDSEQEYARVHKLLGNRRLLCFCNDGKDGICKIRGAMCKGPKKHIIEVGDIVLISFRDLEDDGEESKVVSETSESITGSAAVFSSGRKDIADILLKYERSQWRYIRNESDIHSQLLPGGGAAQDDDIFEDAETGQEVDIDEENLDIEDI